MYSSLCENDWDHFCLLKYLNYAGTAGGMDLKVSKALWMYCYDQNIGDVKWNRVSQMKLGT